MPFSYRQHNVPVDGDCEFINCKPHNIVIFNRNEMCLLKNNVIDTEIPSAENGYSNGIDCSVEMDTSSEQDCSVIVVDD